LLRQINAAGQRPIRWYFSEKEAADFVRVQFYFNRYIRDRIDIEVRPFQEDDNERTTLSVFHLVGAPATSRDPSRDRAKILGHTRWLSAADPFFTPWNVLDKPAMAALPLAAARTRIATIVEKNVVRNDSDQPEPQSGYSAIGVTDNPITSRVVQLTVKAGAVFPGSNVMLVVGDPYLAPTDPAIVNYPRFRQALWR